MSVILTLLLLTFLLLFLFRSPQNRTIQDLCKHGHKWVYKKQPDNEDIEYLVCNRCGKFPGTEGIEERG